jgi:hypothetical protein
MSFTGLHLRKRIRRRVVRIIDRLLHLLDEEGAPAPAPATSHVRPTAPPTLTPPPAAPAAAEAPAAPAEAPPAAAAPEAPTPSAPAEPARPARPKRPATPALPPLPQPETPTKVAAKETPAEKQKKHWERARRGVLRFVLEKGGQATLRELHEHSESTYFIAHVSFSRLMEELTGEKLLDYDHDTATATLTEAGRAILA